MSTSETANPPNALARFFTSIGQHPIGFWFFFWGEFAERCSFYGMLSILPRYMAEEMQFGQSDATSYTHLFIAACYFLPLLGGFIADNYFGKYWTIVGFSIPYILGHVILGIETVPCLVMGLALLAMGSGVIKPNISTLMGQTYDAQRPGQDQLRSDAFGMFYVAINIGSFIAQDAVPRIRTGHSYWLAFLFPAALMVVAFLIFAAGKRFYAHPPIVRRETTPEERALKWQTLFRLLGLFVLVMFFWAIFDQSHSTWVLFAKDYMDCTMFGSTIEPDSIQKYNPIFIVILLPIVRIVFRVLDARGIQIRPTDKMIVGFLLTAATMAIMAAAAAITTPEHKVSVWWQVGAFFVITVAEILISVTGLELAYTAAPKSMTGFVTACWLLMVGLANLVINAPLGQLYGPDRLPPVTFFAMLTGMMIVVTAAFFFVAKRFNREPHAA